MTSVFRTESQLQHPAKPNPSNIVKFVSRKTRDMIYNCRQVLHKLNQATKKSNTILDNVQLSTRTGLAGTNPDEISFQTVFLTMGNSSIVSKSN